MKRVLWCLVLVAAPLRAEVLNYAFQGRVDSGSYDGVGAGSVVSGGFNVDMGGGLFYGSDVFSDYNASRSFQISIGNSNFTRGDDFSFVVVNQPSFDALQVSDAPVEDVQGNSGDLSFSLGSDANLWDDTDLSHAREGAAPGFSLRRWGLTVRNKVGESFEVFGDIVAVSVTGQNNNLAWSWKAGDSKHDKYGTFIGTMKDGYPAGSD
jgi:hypothetical protein